MEIIDELEPSKRGIYAGAVGYLGFNGDMDLAIAIRTAVIKDQTCCIVQAGAGIVADSVPDNEWTETQNKALADRARGGDAADLNLTAVVRCEQDFTQKNEGAATLPLLWGRHAKATTAAS